MRSAFVGLMPGHARNVVMGRDQFIRTHSSVPAGTADYTSSLPHAGEARHGHSLVNLATSYATCVETNVSEHHIL